MTLRSHALSLAVALALPLAGHAQGAAKDVVVDRVTGPLVTVGAAPRNDAMIVSVLLEQPDGTLLPRSTETAFNTGDRFRVKLLASREGRVALCNTPPSGIPNPEPVWRGEVRPGQETISPRLRLSGTSGGGFEQLHAVLEPPGEANVCRWLAGHVANKTVAKDIVLDQQSTPQATYLLAAPNTGLVATMRIFHR
ncbi:MAG: hypothetical protein V4864_12430 [Pseudomonadota bacterium]